VRKSVAQAIVLGIFASAVGIALGLLIDWFPAQGSAQAKKVDTLWDVLIIASVPIFVLVVSVVLFSVWKFRMKPGQENQDGPPIHGNTTLEIVWTAIPAIILVGLCTYAYAVLTDIEKKKPGEMTVGVTGEQFAWTFEYPGPGGQRVLSNRLYLPKDTPVHFKVKSKDVIHDFWVPEFRMKVDAVPGITTSYRVTPIRTGDFPVVCAELCGLGHSTMRQDAYVLPKAKFNQWLAQQRSSAAKTT
jgi:cytochrome c oxidase subunit 2